MQQPPESADGSGITGSDEQRLRDRVAELERLLIAKDRFLATMSHDLRSPLNAIIGFTGTLLMQLPGPLNEDQLHQLGIVRDSAQQLNRLLSDVLDLARLQSGRTPPRRERLDCRPMVEEVATRLRHLAERKSLALEVSGAQTLPVVSDPRAVQQVIHQLLDNAIKFSDRGAVNMELRTVQREGHAWAEIRVTDQGAGFAGIDRDRLCEAFRDPDCPIRIGSGLGLHLARSFTRLAGGQLEMDSEPGKGSRFSLLLPGE
jgi:protein-histidine pros-kinase